MLHIVVRRVLGGHALVFDQLSPRTDPHAFGQVNVHVVRVEALGDCLSGDDLHTGLGTRLKSLFSSGCLDHLHLVHWAAAGSAVAVAMLSSGLAAFVFLAGRSAGTARTARAAFGVVLRSIRRRWSITVSLGTILVTLPRIARR